jgi:hypothetical protein
VNRCYLVIFSPRGAGACVKDRQRQAQKDGCEFSPCGLCGLLRDTFPELIPINLFVFDQIQERREAIAHPCRR